jgi:hypothetical protein
MGAKLWWRWLKYPTELWAKLWKKEYAPHTNEAHLIGFKDQIQGSNIQKHAFWEIRDGQNALFWTDS